MKKDYGTLRRHAFALPFELVMAGGVVVTFFQHNWVHLLAAAFTLTISFAPLVLERVFRLRLSVLVQTMYVGFIFASMFAGEVFYMYGRIIIWDDITHFVSGLLIGLGAMMWLDILTRRSPNVRMPVWLQAILIFCVTATVVVLWEVVEFASDQWFGTFSQGNDLFDTMTDLILGMSAGLIMMVLSVLHLRGRRVIGLRKFLEHFQRTNHEK